MVEQIKHQNKGKRSSIIIVAEGDDAGGSLEIMKKVKPYLPDFDLKATILGHIQRGGSPSAFDRVLATRMGAFGVSLLIVGKTNLMIGSQGDNLITTPIIEGISRKTNPLEQDKLELLKKLLTHN